MAQQANGKEGAQEPAGGWAASAVHDVVGDSLDILDAAPDGILVLAVGLRLAAMGGGGL